MEGLVTQREIQDEDERSWVGRLFTSKPKPKIQEVHLITFVTARIVDRAEKPVGK